MFKVESVNFLFYLFLAFFLNGCAIHLPSQPSMPLVPSLEVDKASAAFKKAAASAPGSTEAEQARIEYLLERIGDSPYNFIRNGSRYNWKHAAIHLRWKYLRNQKQIKNAEDFIDRIATRSKISGEQYWVILPDKSRRPLREFLIHELYLLDQAVRQPGP